MSNSIHVINPFRFAGTWVFTDQSVGLRHEPFVAGVPEIIDHLVGPDRDRFQCFFAEMPFPGADIMLVHEYAEFGGHWYRLHGTEYTGWLCPAIFKYFESAPEQIYVRIN